MKRKFSLVLFLFSLVLINPFKTYAEDYPFAYLGKYGLQLQPNLKAFQDAYVGKTVMYITGAKVSAKDKEFPGIIGKRYTITKISGGNEVITLTMQEKGSKEKIKMPIRIADFESIWNWKLKNTFNISSKVTVPLLILDEFNKTKSEYFGKIYSKEGSTQFEIVDIFLSDDHYPNIYLQILDRSNNKTFNLDAINHIDDLQHLGTTYRNPIVKAYYEVVGLEYKKEPYGNKEEILYFKLRNSITKDEDTYRAENAESQCFKEDIRGGYKASLVQVEKPSDESNRYSKSEIVKDSLNKYHYADNNINIAIEVGKESINFIMKNVSQHSLKIIWNDAVYVDSHGNTSKVMHKGVKYIDRDNDQPASTIIRGAKIEETVIPTSKVYRDDILGWTQYPLFLFENKNNIEPVRLMLPIQIKDVVNEYIFVFDVKYGYIHPERIVDTAM